MEDGNMSQTFEKICATLITLHNKKGVDYGKGNDQYANVRASLDFGVLPWVGALIRQNDKIKRLQSFVTKGRLENESVEDSLMDNAVYAIIALVLYYEQEASHVTPHV